MVPTNIAELELLRKQLQELSQSLASYIKSSSTRLNHYKEDQVYKAPEIDSEKQISNISNKLKLYKIHQEYVKEILNALDVFEDTCFPPDGWITSHLYTLKKTYPNFFKLHNLSPVLISIEELQRLHSPKIAEELLKIFDEHQQFNVVPVRNKANDQNLSHKVVKVPGKEKQEKQIGRNQDNSIVTFSIATSPTISSLHVKPQQTSNATKKPFKTKI